MDWYWIVILALLGIVLVLVIWGIRQFVQQDPTFQTQQNTLLQHGICVPGHIIKY